MTLVPEGEALPEDLTDDALTADFRVFQRRRGHRYSIDDVITAEQALTAMPLARRCLDLGCGIGSVLLMVAWRLPEASLVGIEAQDVSLRLARENVRRNGLDPRVTLLHGDLRDASLLGETGPFDLVTGTPPYMPEGTGTPSPDPQRAYARQERRGGVEAYLEAACRVVSPDGVVVVCADARAPERVTDSAASLGLHPHERRDIIPRTGSAPLFSVWTLRRAPGELSATRFEARDEAGARTDAYRALRRFFGLGRE